MGREAYRCGCVSRRMVSPRRTISLVGSICSTKGPCHVLTNVSNDGLAEGALPAHDGVSHADATVVILADIDDQQATFRIDADDLSALQRTGFDIGARFMAQTES